MDVALTSFLFYGDLPFCNISKKIDTSIIQFQLFLSHLVHWKSDFLSPEILESDKHALTFLWHNGRQRMSYFLPCFLLITYKWFLRIRWSEPCSTRLSCDSFPNSSIHGWKYCIMVIGREYARSFSPQVRPKASSSFLPLIPFLNFEKMGAMFFSSQ